MNITAQNRLREWAQMVDGWQKSGMTQESWCKSHDISLDAFKYRKRKVEKYAAELMNENTDTDIVAVPSEAITPAASSVNEEAVFREIEIKLSRANIKVYEDTSPELLRTAFEVLVPA